MNLPALAAFLGGAAVSLAMSWLLVSRLERLAERLGFSEALLGIVAALAADAPEISAAVSALTSRHTAVGAGVVIGSNVFNLAALLGLGAVVAGQIRLHRKVVLLSGTIAIWVAMACVGVVTGVLPVVGGLLLAVAVLAVYLILLATEAQGLGRIGVPARWWTWLRSAITEEEIELDEAIRPRPGRWPDVAVGGGALVVVVTASVVMERAATVAGRNLGLPDIITGGLILAAVTSLPNAVAAVYLASRGRGAATLSTALNSNAINVVAGLLLPAAVVGLGARSGPTELVAWWYAGLTIAILLATYRHSGLGRRAGLAILSAYAVFAVALTISAYHA